MKWVQRTWGFDGSDFTKGDAPRPARVQRDMTQRSASHSNYFSILEYGKLEFVIYNEEALFLSHVTKFSTVQGRVRNDLKKENWLGLQTRTNR